jgi:hypothetical protein
MNFMKLCQYALIGTIAMGFFIEKVSGHHFKGLPHFNYYENYPQVPQDEFLGQEGEYEFSLVLYDFQGIQRDDAQQPDDARLYLIIYNLRENRVYNGPLTLEVLDRGDVVYAQDYASSQEESIYTLQQTLPSTGKYALRITFLQGDTGQAIIPFLLSSQKIHWGKWIAGILVIFVAVVAVGSRRARVSLDRKENAKAQRRAGKQTPKAVALE